MVQILDRVPSFGEKLAPTLASAIGDIAKGYQQKRTNEQDTRIIEGLTSNPNASPMEQIKAFGSLSKDKQAALSPLFSQMLKTQQKQQESQTKVEENIAKEQRHREDETLKKEAPIKGALQIVEEQKELLKTGNLGRFLGLGQRKFGSTLSKEGIKDRAKYGRLGKSLIQHSSNINIRNRAEFETLAEGLTDPTLHQSEIEGNLEAIEKILQNQLRPSLESFYQ